MLLSLSTGHIGLIGLCPAQKKETDRVPNRHRPPTDRKLCPMENHEKNSPPRRSQWNPARNPTTTSFSRSLLTATRTRSRTRDGAHHLLQLIEVHVTPGVPGAVDGPSQFRCQQLNVVS